MERDSLNEEFKSASVYVKEDFASIIEHATKKTEISHLGGWHSIIKSLPPAATPLTIRTCAGRYITRETSVFIKVRTLSLNQMGIR